VAPPPRSCWALGLAVGDGQQVAQLLGEGVEVAALRGTGPLPPADEVGHLVLNGGDSRQRVHSEYEWRAV
jgi:hypothetical protein